MADDDPEAARERLFRLVSGYRLTQALYVAAKLGIADRLVGGPKDAESLARELGAHPDRLFRVLRALASFGVFTLDSERRFGLTSMGDRLRSDVPGSLAAFATFSGEEAYRAFGELLHTVMTGETAFDYVYGMGHFDYLAGHPEASATFHRTMAGSLGTSKTRWKDATYATTTSWSISEAGRVRSSQPCSDVSPLSGASCSTCRTR